MEFPVPPRCRRSLFPHPGPAAAVLTFLLLTVMGPAARASADKTAPASGTPRLHYSVSMERPNLHYLHVTLRCEGLPGSEAEFRMPAWTPGYYKIMDYAGNVANFRAADGEGRPLPWTKTSKNVWKVTKGKSPVVEIVYDVHGSSLFIASNYLADDRAFVCPAATFMYVPGLLKEPAEVEVRPLPGWTGVATGLDPIADRPNTFLASDMDRLYDSPILAGRLVSFTFEVGGIRHRMSALDLSWADDRFRGDLKRIVEAADSIVGDIPYKHFDFLMLGEGIGGLEHFNSTALTYDQANMSDQESYKSYLTFLAHEFFHAYNVKSIRPIALGPFDYDRENYTRMLWVSEGITDYYQFMIMNRAGLLTSEETLDRLGRKITKYERSPGRTTLSATAAGIDTWMNYFVRDEHTANTSATYYDSGAVLGLLLDLKIRSASHGRATLDDVMRTLYFDFYKAKGRGFTDDEFRKACEKAAGADLSEIFVDYAEKAAPIDYTKYLSYAGLEIEGYQSRRDALPWFGASFENSGGRPIVSWIEWGSPAADAGLSSGDEIIALNDVRTGSSRDIESHLERLRIGDPVRAVYFRNGRTAEAVVKLTARPGRSFRLRKSASPSPDQKALLDAWLKQ